MSAQTTRSRSRRRRSLSQAPWYHIGLTYDGSSKVAGLRLFLDGAAARTRALVDNLHRSIIYTTNKGSWGDVPPLRLGKRQERDDRGRRLRRSPRVTTASCRRSTWRASAATTRLFRARSPTLPRHGRGPTRSTPRALHARRRMASTRARCHARRPLRRRENDLLTPLTEVMTMRICHGRGRRLFSRAARTTRPLERVEPAHPQPWARFRKPCPPIAWPGAVAGRFRKHRSTSRVMANRYWALLFGRGLVPTLADFGSQGPVAVAPALLDWLATSLVQSGWDLKAFQKTAGDVGHVPAVLDCRCCASGCGSGQRLAFTRALASARRRADS
jgi:hypothetical protein